MSVMLQELLLNLCQTISIANSKDVMMRLLCYVCCIIVPASLLACQPVVVLSFWVFSLLSLCLFVFLFFDVLWAGGGGLFFVVFLFGFSFGCLPVPDRAHAI
jgi:hypothetical protein